MARVVRRSVVDVVVLEVARGSGWVRDRLAEFLWSNQREILQAVVRHRYVAFKSAHDTGKGHGASRAVTWWLDTREDPINDDCTDNQAGPRDSVAYIGQAHRKGDLPGRITPEDE
jgi:hypothetical protein